jgi:hypothetical protein
VAVTRDRGDPVYSIGDGMVVFARDCHGWERLSRASAYRENGSIKNITHYMDILAFSCAAANRSRSWVGPLAHARPPRCALAFKIRKNIRSGMSRHGVRETLANI